MKDNNKDIRILKYLRVSLDDEGDDESNSISYQREFLDSKRAEIVNKIETFEREMRPLRSIRDNYEKTVLTLDRFSTGNYDGIRVINLVDWLGQ